MPNIIHNINRFKCDMSQKSITFIEIVIIIKDINNDERNDFSMDIFIDFIVFVSNIAITNSISVS